jgi:exodeoxyribonuclease-5
MNIATQFVPDSIIGTDPLEGLNDGQREGAEDFLQFLLSKGKEYALSGPGGTGKTYLLNKMLSSVMDQYEKATALLGRNTTYYTVALTATTNKATEVIRRATHQDAKTIHSFLGLKIRTDYHSGGKYLVKTDNWKVHSNLLLIIDEASMIDFKLKKLINEATDSSCKIVYIGDPCQLPPVKEILSEVYMEEKPYTYLTEPMRNSGSDDLINLCDLVRNVVETLDFSSIETIHTVPGVIDHLDDIEANHFIETYFLNEDVDARILAFSNARVNEYNAYLRTLRGYPDKFTVGERLVAASAMVISNKVSMQVEEEFHVVEDLGPSVFVVDSSDANAVIHTQKLNIKSSRFSAVVHVPTDPDRALALKKHYFKHKYWAKAYSIEENIADLRPTTSCTVHKSQGSTYDCVFIDLNNIGKCTHNNELARMLYVAVTRAQSRIVFHGSLPRRLFV